MHTIYSHRLLNVEKSLKTKNYYSAARDAFELIESGLHETFKNVQDYLEKNKRSSDWSNILDRFQARTGKPFNSEPTLGSYALLGYLTPYWDYVREMSPSNLRFIRMINWTTIKNSRNKLSHGKNNDGRNSVIQRHEALEAMFWPKVILYDLDLLKSDANIVPQVLDTMCNSCNHAISGSWNYCATCGEGLNESCDHCKKIINKSLKVCPYCDSLRDEFITQTNELRTYKAYVEAVWSDYVVTPLERKWLNQQRLLLGLTQVQAENVEREVMPKNVVHFSELIEATLVDGKIDSLEREFLLKKGQQLKIEKSTINLLISEAEKMIKKEEARKRFGLFDGALKVNSFFGL